MEPALRRQKSRLRRYVRSLILAMPPEERLQKSRLIALKTAGLETMAKARNVMAYYPLADEVDTHPLLELLFAAGKTVFLPVTDAASGIAPVPVMPKHLNLLARSTLGVPEPIMLPSAPLEQIEAVIVPGRAFDRSCNRLGRGRGYYDRFLPQLPAAAIKVGLAFDCQVLEKLPTSQRDVLLDLLVTEAEVIVRLQAPKSPDS